MKALIFSKNSIQSLIELRGSYQLSPFTKQMAKIVIGFSIYQNIGPFLISNDFMFGLKPFHELFCLSTFSDVIFKTVGQSEIAYLIFHGLLLAYFLWAFVDNFRRPIRTNLDESDSAAKNEQFYQTYFLSSVHQFFIHLLLLPVLEAGAVVLSCPNMSEKSQEFTDLTVSYCSTNLSGLHTTITAIALSNMILGILLAFILIIYSLPRNAISENYLVNESKRTDFLIFLQKLVSSLIFITQFDKNDWISPMLIAFQILICFCILQTLRTETSFQSISIFRFFIRSQLFFLTVLMFQFWFVLISKMNSEKMINAPSFIAILMILYQISKSLETQFFWALFARFDEKLNDKKNCFFLLILCLRYAKQNEAFKFLYNGKKKEAEIERFTNIILDHFRYCQNQSNCICPTLKSGIELRDPKSDIVIHFPNPNNIPINQLVISISSTFFIKHFVYRRLESTLRRNPKDQFCIISFLKLIIFEDPNYLMSALLIGLLINVKKTEFQNFDFQFLQFCLEKESVYTSNHKNKKDNFINIEKLSKMSDWFHSAQTNMFVIIDCFSALFSIVPRNNLDDPETEERLKRLLSTINKRMKCIRQLFSDIPKNLKINKLCELFLEQICHDRESSQIIKKQSQILLTKFTKTTTDLQMNQFKCSFKKFFFNNEESIVFQVDMLSHPHGRISGQGKQFWKFMGVESDYGVRQEISSFIPERIARNHLAYFFDYLKTNKSNKILGSGVTVIQKGKFVEKKNIMIKPFYDNLLIKVLYTTYIENLAESPKPFLIVDKLGFIEGISKDASQRLNLERFEINDNLQNMNIMYLFPDLAEFFFFKSAAFRNKFNDLIDTKLEIFELMDDNSSIFSFDLASEMKNIPNDFDEQRQKLNTIFGRKQKTDFAEFRKELNKIYTTSNLKMYIKFEILKKICGDEDIYFIFESSFVKDHFLNSSDQLKSLKSYTNDAHLLIKLLSLNEEPINSGSELEKHQFIKQLTEEQEILEKAVKSLATNDSIEFANSQKLLKENFVKLRKSPLSVLTTTVNKVEQINYVISHRKSNLTHRKTSSDEESDDISDLNTNENNKFELKKRKKKRIGVLDTESIIKMVGNINKKNQNQINKASMHKENNNETADPIFIETAQNLHSESGNKRIKIKRTEPTAIQIEEIEIQNGDDFQNVNNENLQKTKFVKMTKTSSNHKNHKRILVLLALLPIVYFLIMVFSAQKFFKSRVLNLGITNAGAGFYKMLGQSAVQLFAAVKNNSIVTSLQFTKNLGRALMILIKDFKIAVSYILGDVFDTEITMAYYISKYFTNFSDIMFTTAQMFDHVNSGDDSDFTTRINLEKVINELYSAPLLQQDRENLQEITIFFIVVTILFLFAVLALLHMKRKFINKN